MPLVTLVAPTVLVAFDEPVVPAEFGTMVVVPGVDTPVLPVTVVVDLGVVEVAPTPFGVLVGFVDPVVVGDCPTVLPGVVAAVVSVVVPTVPV